MFAMHFKKPVATYQDILDLPEGVNGELIGGELYTQSRPANRHFRATTKLLVDLVNRFEDGIGGPGGWIFAFEPELRMSGNIFAPDIAGWRTERLPTIPDDTHMALAPDWICEILSPSTASHDRLRKAHYYARAGVPHLWLVDPQLKTLEVFRLVGEHYSLVQGAEGSETGRFEPFDAVELALQPWWIG